MTVEAITRAVEVVPRAREVVTTPASQGLDIVCEPPDVFAPRLRRKRAPWTDAIRARGVAAG